MPACTHDGTTIVYNDTIIRDVLTNQIQQRVMYDPSGVDPIGLTVRVDATGYAHASGDELDPNFGHYTGATPTDAMRDYLLRRLNMPRRPFRMTVGNETLFSIDPHHVEWCKLGHGYQNPSSINADIDNGPKPSTTITAVIGQHSYRVNFVLEFTIQICNDATSQFQGLVSLRFAIHDDIDTTDWTTNRTMLGRLRVKSKAIHIHQVANAFAVPPLPRGWQRQQISFHEDRGGLELEFVIRDKQVYAAAPKPATDWGGTYTVQVNFGGVTCESECNVWLKGALHTPKTELLTLAAKILDAKTHVMDIDKKHIIMGATFTEDLKNNHVTAKCRIKHAGSEQRAVLVNFRDPEKSLSFGKPLDPDRVMTVPPYDPEVSYVPGRKPGSLAGLFSCVLTTPCCPIWFSPTNPPAYEHEEPEDEPSLIYPLDSVAHELAHVDLLPDPDAEAVTQQHKDAMYEDVRVTSRIITNTGIVAAVTSNGVATFLQSHGTVQFREVTLEAVRVGAWPEMPSPLRKLWTDSNGIQHALIKATHDIDGATLDARAGVDARSTRVRMLYALSRPVAENEPMPACRIPYRASTSEDYQVVAQTFFVEPEEILDKRTG